MALTLTEIVNLSYTDLFNEVKTLKNGDSNLDGWDIDNPNDILRFVLDYYLLSLERLARFANNTSQEFSIATSLTRQNVINHALQLGYLPTNYVNSSTLINATITSLGSSATVDPFAVVLSAPASDGTAVFFTNPSAITLPASTTTVNNIPFVEGRLVTKTFNSSGEAFQSFIVRDRVVDYSISVTVDAVTWTEIDTLLAASNVDTRFQYRRLDVDTHQFIFGDNVNGAKPAANLEIAISYISGGGTRGNVRESSITRIVSIAGASATRFTAVVNPNQATGGSDPDSVERIRSLAIRVPRLQNRLVSIEDIKTFAESYDGVARANVIPHINYPIVQIIPEGGGNPTLTLKNEVKAAIDERIVVGYKVGVTNPSYKGITLTVDVTIDPNYDATTIQTYASTQLSNMLNPVFQEADGTWSRAFGEPVLLSDIYDRLISYPGILSVNVSSPVPPANTTSDILESCDINEIYTNVSPTVITVTTTQASTYSMKSRSEKTTLTNPKFLS